VAAPLTILLPPSEGKAAGGDGPPWAAGDGAFGGALAARRREVVKALGRAKGGDATLLGVGGRHLEHSRLANQAVVAGAAGTLPAWARYTGVVHDHLGVASLP